MKVNDSRIQENHHNFQSFYNAKLKKVTLACLYNMTKKPQASRPASQIWQDIGSREELIT